MTTTRLQHDATTAEIRTALEALEPGGPAIALENPEPGEGDWSARRREDGTWRLEAAPDEDGDTGRPLEAATLEEMLELAGGTPGGADDRAPAWILETTDRTGHDENNETTAHRSLETALEEARYWLQGLEDTELEETTHKDGTTTLETEEGEARISPLQG